jgi:drug/metabolite transporter (DMT)-like permease
VSITAFTLVILAALVHATWNLLAKRASAAGPVFIFAYTIVSCTVYLPWVVWLIAHHAMPWSWPVIGCILFSGILHIGYSLCLQRGYQVANLSVVYPVARGTGPMLSSIAAFLVLGETPTTLGVIGLVAVIIGIGLISTQGDLSVFWKPGGQSGIRWGTATGGFIAAYTVNDAWGVKQLGIPAVIMDWGSNLVRAIVLFPFIARNTVEARLRMKGCWLLALAVGLLWPVSYILVLTVLRMGAPVSVVAPAREMSMMIGALLGMAVLREPVGKWRLVGCAILIAGVLLLSRS